MPSSSMAERPAVNRNVAGSSPAWVVCQCSIMVMQAICNRQIVGSSPIVGFPTLSDNVR